MGNVLEQQGVVSNNESDNLTVNKILVVENNSNMFVDREKYVVMQNEVEISLPKKEFELLALLMSRPNNVFTREKIFSSVWGEDIIVGDRTIDVHIRKLREKIGEDYIKTVKGVGYKFVDVEG